MWQLPRGEKLASSEQRTVDLMGSEAPMTTQEPSKFYKPSFDLTENMMVMIVNSRPWKPPPLYCAYFFHFAHKNHATYLRLDKAT
jgi:hypothetical protein